MLIIILVFMSERVKGEDHLSYSNWKKNLSSQSFPKYWISYVEQLAYNLIDKSLISKTLILDLQLLKHKTMYFSLYQQTNKKIHLINDQERTFKRSRVETKPTVIIRLSVPKHYLQLGAINGTYAIKFSLHKKLKLNITFITIDLQVIYKRCELESVSVSNILFRNYRTNFDYCGINFHFSLFPSSHHSKYRLFLRQLERRLPVEIHTSFSVISTDIVESFASKEKLSAETVATFHVKIQKIMIYILKIQVEKYKSIKLKLHPKHDAHFILFSGSGYLSPVEQIYKSKTKHVGTFLCLVQLIASTEVANTTRYLGFKGFPLQVTKINITPENDTKVAHQDTELGNKVIKLQTDVKGYLNVTIMSFHYQGPTSLDCIYAGMVIYEFQVNEFQESFSLCKKYTPDYFNDIFHGSVYSTNNAFLIIFYHHVEYTSFSVKLKALYSFCKGIKINTCEIRWGSYRKLLELKDLFSLTNHIFDDLNLLVFSKSCIAFQFYTEPDVETEHNNPACSFHFILSTKQPEEQFWKYTLQGYLQGIHDRSIVLVTYGDDYNKTVNVRTITQVYKKQRCRKTFDWYQKYCDYQSEKGILVDAIFFVKTPAHKNTATFNLFLYRWSHSWMNFVIQWVGKIMESKIRTAITYQHHKPHLLKRIVPREETVLFTEIISNEESDVTLSVTTNLSFYHKLQWSQRLKVGKQNPNNKLTVALQGRLECVFVQSNKNSSVVLEYIWLHAKLEGNSITGVGGYMCNGKRYQTEISSLFSKRAFHLVRKTKTKMYHFFKNYTLPCDDTQGFYSCVAMCNAELLSWRQA